MKKKKGIWVNNHTFHEFTEPAKTVGEEIATRKRSLDFISMMGYLPNPDETLKKMGKDIKVYKEIKGESQVSTCILSRTAGVQSLLHGINRGKAKSKQAKIIEKVFKNLPVKDIIKDILDANYFGYQPLEITWVEKSGLILPGKIEAKPAEWFCFDDTNQLRFKSRNNPIYGEELPDRKFLCPRYNASYDNPYGLSLLSSLFWYATFKKDALKFWIICVEKYGMPFIVGKIRRGASDDEMDDLLEKLDQMCQDAIAVIYDDSSVEVKSDPFKASSSGMFKDLISLCNEEIAKVTVGQTLTTQVGETGGAYAASQTHQEVRQDIVDMDATQVSQTLNQLIKWIDEINFNSSEVPTFDLWHPEDVDKDLADRDKTLTETGVKFTKSYYIKAYGLEEDDFDLVEKQPVPQNLPGEPAQFAEGNTEDEIDVPEELQRIGEEILKPVIELVKNSNNYNEIMEGLSTQYPLMRTEKLEELLERAMFWSEVEGRQSDITR